MEILSEPRNRYSLLVEGESLPIPEFGDYKTVKVVFGLTETFTYLAAREGKIKSVLVPGRGRGRGKRLFDFASIRKFLVACAEKEAAAK
jgi:hypothetical protein